MWLGRYAIPASGLEPRTDAPKMSGSILDLRAADHRPAERGPDRTADLVR